MHNVIENTERTLDAACFNEQGIVDHICSSDRSPQAADQLRLTVEMAIEWAHLGGD